MNQAAPGVLVTRPAHQSAALIEQIRHLGLNAIPCPVIQIHETPPDLTHFRLEQYQIIIFISANAVEIGLKYLKNLDKIPEIQICAIGRQTTRRLIDHGIDEVIQAETGFNSEALLNLASLSRANINQQNILIVRGQGGREYLADELRHRGARVDYLEVYQREIASTDVEPVIRLWSEGKINIITVSSNESLKNLYHILQDRGLELLLNTPLITPGERCSDLARQLGFKNQILQAASAADDDIIKQLNNWLDSKQ